MSPLPAPLDSVQRSIGWLPQLVKDPADSFAAVLEDFYMHEQQVFVCLPHVVFPHLSKGPARSSLTSGHAEKPGLEAMPAQGLTCTRRFFVLSSYECPKCPNHTCRTGVKGADYSFASSNLAFIKANFH